MNSDKPRTKKIAAIAPEDGCMDEYGVYLARRGDYAVDHYPTLAAFRATSPVNQEYRGFIVDLRSLLKADSADKEAFYRLMETYPVMRIAQTRGGSGVTGNIRGKTLKDGELFSFFFELVAQQNEKVRKTRLGVLAASTKSRELYARFLEPFKDMCDLEYYASGGELSAGLTENPYKLYNGFIIDLKTLLKAEMNDKDFYYELIESFPVLRVSHSPDGKVIKGNYQNRSIENDQLFHYFLDEVCHSFPGRGIRMFPRRAIFLNVLVHSPETVDNKESAPWIANTLNVSGNGLFIISTHSVRKGDIRHIVLRDLSHQEPIEIQVKWTLPWGQTIRHLPGFGAALLNISPAQKEELTSILKKKA